MASMSLLVSNVATGADTYLGSPCLEDEPATARKRDAGHTQGPKHRMSCQTLHGKESQQGSERTRSELSDPIGLEEFSPEPSSIVEEDAIYDDDSSSTPCFSPQGTAGSEDPPDNSIYPQVRASVQATDNTHLSISTPRMWTLSLLFAFLGSATNLFFSLRYPSVAVTPIIALILVHPMGKGWDKLLKRGGDPQESFERGVSTGLVADMEGTVRTSWLRQLRLWLGQGKWNEKEHACVYISSNVSFGFAFATDVSLAPEAVKTVSYW